MDDELRDMENELNMTKLLSNKGRPEDITRISELEAELEKQKADHESEVSGFKEKLETYEQKINNIGNLEIQIESLASEVTYKTEQQTRLQTEVFEKDADILGMQKEIEDLKAENERLKKLNEVQKE